MWCAFIRRLKIEKKANIVKGRYMMMSNITDSMQLDSDDDGNPVMNNQGMVHRYMELAAEDEAKTQRQKQKKQAEREARKAAAAPKAKKTALEDFFE